MTGDSKPPLVKGAAEAGATVEVIVDCHVRGYHLTAHDLIGMRTRCQSSEDDDASERRPGV